MALFTTAVLMTASALDVSMATGSGNCASIRQVVETEAHSIVMIM